MPPASPTVKRPGRITPLCYSPPMSGDAPARRTLLRRALRWLRLPLLLLLAGCAVLPWLERQLLYFPDAVHHTTPARLRRRGLKP